MFEDLTNKEKVKCPMSDKCPMQHCPHKHRHIVMIYTPDNDCTNIPCLLSDGNKPAYCE